MFKKTIAALVIVLAPFSVHAQKSVHGFADAHTAQWKSVGTNDEGEFFIDLKGISYIEGSDNRTVPELIEHNNGFREQLTLGINCASHTFSAFDQLGRGNVTYPAQLGSPVDNAMKVLCKSDAAKAPAIPVSDAHVMARVNRPDTSPGDNGYFVLTDLPCPIASQTKNMRTGVLKLALSRAWIGDGRDAGAMRGCWRVADMGGTNINGEKYSLEEIFIQWQGIETAETESPDGFVWTAKGGSLLKAQIAQDREATEELAEWMKSHPTPASINK
jgi:hypothetical protein